jgi:hypothetical protein
MVLTLTINVQLSFMIMILSLIFFQVVFGLIVFSIMWSGIKDSRKQVVKNISAKS